jgi:hypothetical protein
MFRSKASLKSKKKLFMFLEVTGIYATNKLTKSSLKSKLFIKSISDQTG